MTELQLAALQSETGWLSEPSARMQPAVIPASSSASWSICYYHFQLAKTHCEKPVNVSGGHSLALEFIGASRHDGPFHHASFAFSQEVKGFNFFVRLEVSEILC